MTALLGVMPFSSSGRTPDYAPSSDFSAPGSTSDHTDYNAPHVIHSKTIQDFSVRFEFHEARAVRSRSGLFVPVYSGIPQGSFSLNIKRMGEQAFFNAKCHGSRDTFDVQEYLPSVVLDELQRLIDEHEIARLNGYCKWNSALGHGFDLKVLYASGETIAAGAEGGYAVMPYRYWSEIWFIDFMMSISEKYRFGLVHKKDFSGPLRAFVAEAPYSSGIDGGSFADGAYKFELFYYGMEENSEGRIRVVFRDASGTAVRAEVSASQEDFALLAELLRKEGTMQLDGYQYSGFMPEQCEVDFRIEADFISGDRIFARAAGPATVMPAEHWNVLPLMEFFRNRLKRGNASFSPLATEK